jgi:hypothetical protein
LENKGITEKLFWKNFKTPVGKVDEKNGRTILRRALVAQIMAVKCV